MDAVLTQLGFGFLAGYSAGLALRFVGRIVAFIVGLVFIALQLLAYFGYVQIDWYRIQHDLEPALSGPALQQAWHRFMEILTCNAPFGGGFAVGLAAGIRGR